MKQNKISLTWTGKQAETKGFTGPVFIGCSWRFHRALFVNHFIFSSPPGFLFFFFFFFKRWFAYCCITVEFDLHCAEWCMHSLLTFITLGGGGKVGAFLFSPASISVQLLHMFWSFKHSVYMCEQRQGHKLLIGSFKTWQVKLFRFKRISVWKCVQTLSLVWNAS